MSFPSAKGRYYKYSGVDKSPIARYILTPYWNYVTTFMPLWLAPNLITLLGLICILINVATILVLVPDLIGPGPSWMYWSFVVGLWIYSTLDNVDGKQARRTGSSSPLGELFDHGKPPVRESPCQHVNSLYFLV
jgi:ethanolaminephosphotransferase